MQHAFKLLKIKLTTKRPTNSKGLAEHLSGGHTALGDV